LNIIRANINDTDMFDTKELGYGACCFYTEDKLNHYYFKIHGREATLYTNSEKHINEAIEEFLYYSNFIICIKMPDGSILRKQEPKSLKLLDILSIQPSQFYINEKKLSSCKEWIKDSKDVMIPVANINGRVVSLDGHTRLRAANDLGYTEVYTYLDDCSEYIESFVDKAIDRNILNVLDMLILSDEEYDLRWNKYCEDYFENKFSSTKDLDP